MEAGSVVRPEFWAGDSPVLMGGGPELDAPGLIYFRTSGSTGEPKWIGLSRHALQISAAAVNRHLGVDATDCWALTLPVEHVGGFGVLARVWQAGCRLAHFDRKWDAVAFAGWLAKVQATHLSLVPTQVHDLVAAGLRPPDSLRAIVVGGGALGESAGRAARDFGWPVLASYGMTEAGSQVATQGLEVLSSPYVPQPLGLLPCWEAGIGESGRIQIRGESLFSGMLVRDGAGWKYEERRGEWFTTSDTGSLDGTQLRLTGRADTQVKILGELVDPVTVEAELLALSGGSLAPGEIAVVAVADARAGHKLVLVSEAGIDSGIVTKAVETYHAGCPGFRRITTMVVVDRIPRSPLGKTLRQELLQFVEKGRNSGLPFRQGT
jgi:O-succinylbenzoic acid--CoA ligase